MLLDETELAQLGEYLLTSLEPISDADNEALSAYIIALIGNEKPIAQLKRECNEQLEEFLESHTKKFVRDLFSWLENRANNTTKNENTKQPTDTTLVESETQSESKRVKMEVEEPSSREEKNSKASSRSKTAQTYFPIESVSTRFSAPPRPQSHSNHQQTFAHPVPARCPDYEERGFCIRGEECPFPHGADAIRMNEIDMLKQRSQPDPVRFRLDGPPSVIPHQQQDDYDPSDPYFNNSNRSFSRQSHSSTWRGGRGGGSYNSSRGRGENQSSRQSQHSQRAFTPSTSNTTLTLVSIPEDKLSEEPIRTYFNKFGEIVNIVLDVQQSKADIEFRTHEEAAKADASPDPIFDNRFVKLFWKRNSGGFSNSSSSANNASNSEFKMHHFNTGENTATFFPNGEIKPTPPKFSTNDADRLRKRRQLHKQKTDMLAKQLEEQKKILAMVESKTLPEKDRKSLMSSLQILSKSIRETIDIISNIDVAATAFKVIKEGDGESMEVDNSTTTRPTFTGLSTNKWVRQPEGLPQTFTIDNRPKSFKVHGFSQDETTSLDSYLKGLRGVESVELDDKNATFTVNCKNQYVARRVQPLAVKLGDKSFQFTWIYNNSGNSEPTPFANVTNSQPAEPAVN